MQVLVRHPVQHFRLVGPPLDLLTEPCIFCHWVANEASKAEASGDHAHSRTPEVLHLPWDIPMWYDQCALSWIR